MSRTTRPRFFPREDCRIVKTNGTKTAWKSRQDTVEHAYALAFARMYGGWETRWVLPSWVPFAGEL